MGYVTVHSLHASRRFLCSLCCPSCSDVALYSVAAVYPAAGTYAEYATIKSNLLARIPDNTSFDEAASLPLICLTAMQVLAQPFWSVSRALHALMAFCCLTFVPDLFLLFHSLYKHVLYVLTVCRWSKCSAL